MYMDEDSGTLKLPDMQTRLKELRDALGLSQEKVAGSIDISVGYYNRMENGRRPISSKYLQPLADTLRVEVGELFVKTGSFPVKEITVRGGVRAGAWIESYEWSPEDQYTVPAPELPPEARKAFGLRVDGPSMNNHYPEGSVVFCVPLLDFWRDLHSGDHVIAQRKSPDGLFEATIKELVVDVDHRAWLWPRSSDPEYQAPISIPWPTDDDDEFAEVEVEILAVVIGAYISRI